MPALSPYTLPAPNSTPQKPLTGTISSDSQSPAASRRLRSLRCCHRHAAERPIKPPPRDTGAYVPELASRLEDDRRLSDGARHTARKLAEYAYRKHRDDRACIITVSYLARAIGRCRRTAQRHLRQLQAHGYIDVMVMQSGVRMCTGLTVRLLSPLFPRHHASKWPSRLINSGVTPASHNKRFLLIPSKITPVPLALWADRCREGVWRSLMSTLTPIPVAL